MTYQKVERLKSSEGGSSLPIISSRWLFLIQVRQIQDLSILRSGHCVRSMGICYLTPLHPLIHSIITRILHVFAAIWTPPIGKIFEITFYSKCSGFCYLLPFRYFIIPNYNMTTFLLLLLVFDTQNMKLLCGVLRDL